MDGIGHGCSGQAARAAGKATHEPTTLLFSVEKTSPSSNRAKRKPLPMIGNGFCL